MLEKFLEKLLGRQNCELAPDINLSEDFTPPRKFQLYVGVEGTVNCVDVHDSIISRHFVVGYHPIILKKVLSTANGTTATNLGACFI